MHEVAIRHAIRSFHIYFRLCDGNRTFRARQEHGHAGADRQRTELATRQLLVGLQILFIMFIAHLSVVLQSRDYTPASTRSADGYLPESAGKFTTCASM